MGTPTYNIWHLHCVAGVLGLCMCIQVTLACDFVVYLLGDVSVHFGDLLRGAGKKNSTDPPVH
jgi:hypothetical protein